MWTSRFVLDTVLLLLWATAPVLGSQARKPSQKGKLPLAGPSQLLQNELSCARITYWAAPSQRAQSYPGTHSRRASHVGTLFPVQRLWIALGIVLGLLHINIWNKPLPFSSSQDCFTSNTRQWVRKISLLTGSDKKKSSRDKTQSQSTLEHEQLLEPTSLALIQNSNMWYPPPLTQNIQRCSALALKLLNQALSWEAWILK